MTHQTSDSGARSESTAEETADPEPPARGPQLKRFLSYVAPYKWWIVGATLCGLVKFNIPVLFPWVIKDVIDRALAATQPKINEIHVRMAFLVALYVVWTVATYFRSYLADHAAQRVIFDVRRDVYQHLQKLSLSFYEKHQVGSIASRLLGDVTIAQNLVGAAFTNVIMDLSTLALITVLLYRMNGELATLALVALPLYVVVNRHYKRRVKDASARAQQKLEEIAGDVHEKLSGISLIQAYTLEKAEQRNFVADNTDYLRHRMDNIRASAAANAVVGFITSAAPVGVVWYAAIQVAHGRLTVGELTAFYAYLGMFYSPLNRLTELNILVANSQAALHRIQEILDTEPDIDNADEARGARHILGDVQFDHVSFSYRSGRAVLKDIDLTVRSGETVALVGKSGSGKSTLAKLLPRFYDVTDGAVRIDGVDVRELKLKSLRKHIALVPQQPILFSGAVFENILLGRPGAGSDEVVRAAKLANAHEFIRRLPRGYQTEIGEGGVTLSGGQKQRIALARAFLKDAPILILDEATSALDSISEHLVQDAIERLMEKRTTFVIAHRLTTILAADRIVVLQRGRIVETGTHSELNERNGVYRRLCHEQFDSIRHRREPARRKIVGAETTKTRKALGKATLANHS